MAENSKIEWTDHTINFWWGCEKVSPACANCYAERQDAHFHPGIPWQSRYQGEKAGASHWGPDARRLLRVDAARGEALRYERQAVAQGRRFRVFTNSMSDFFEDRRDLDLPRLEALDTIRLTPHLDWLCLTKRPEKILPLIGLAIDRLDKAIMFRGGVLDAESAFRKGDLSSSPDGRTRDRPRGEDLAPQEENCGPLEGWHPDTSMCEGPSGEHYGPGLSSNPRHVEREAGLHRGAPARVDALFRGDSAGDDDQPPQWGQVGQPSVQPGTGELQRSAPPRDTETGSEACRRSGQEPPQNLADGRTGSGDSCSPGRRGTGEGSGAGLQHEAKGDLGHLLPKNLEASAVALRDWLRDWLKGRAPANVWLGTTVEDHEHVKRASDLQLVPAAVRFLSMEPLLGPVDLWPRLGLSMIDGVEVAPIDWVICGGESGPHARPMHPDWARGLRDQCAAAGVPFLFKQWGEWAPFVNEDHYTHGGSERHAHAWIDHGGDDGLCWIVDDDGSWSNWTGKPPMDHEGVVLDSVAIMGRHGKKAAGRLLDGVEHNGYPEVARG